MCERGGTGERVRERERASGPLLIPAAVHTGELSLVVVVLCFFFGLEILPLFFLLLVTGDQPCGLKSKRSCHRNAQVSP